jgi:hypothetical protein
MTANVGQAFFLCGGIFLLSFVAILAFWFVEKLRGDSAPKPGRSSARSPYLR